MKFHIIFSVILGIGLAIGVWLLHSLYLNIPIEFKIADTIIEMQLTVALLLLIVAVFLFGIALRIISLVVLFPSHLKRWRSKSIERKKVKLLAEGIKGLVLGDKNNQHKFFSNAAESGIEPALTYYLAAAASDSKRQDILLRRAANSDGDQMIKAMAKARSQLRADNPNSAAETLRIAGAANSKSSAPLQLLMEACEKSGDLRSSLDVAQRLLEINPTSNSLRITVSNLARRLLVDAENFEDVRAMLGNNINHEPPSCLASVAAQRLAAVHDNQGATMVLAKALKNKPDAMLLEAVALYGSDELVTEAIKTGDTLLAKNHEDSNTLRAVGQLAMRAKLWGQARKAFERAVELHPVRPNYQCLAELSEKEGKSSEEVNRLYRRAADSHD